LGLLTHGISRQTVITLHNIAERGLGANRQFALVERLGAFRPAHLGKSLAGIDPLWPKFAINYAPVEIQLKSFAPAITGADSCVADAYDVRGRPVLPVLCA